VEVRIHGMAILRCAIFNFTLNTNAEHCSRNKNIWCPYSNCNEDSFLKANLRDAKSTKYQTRVARGKSDWCYCPKLSKVVGFILSGCTWNCVTTVIGNLRYHLLRPTHSRHLSCRGCPSTMRNMHSIARLLRGSQLYSGHLLGLVCLAKPCPMSGLLYTGDQCFRPRMG